MGPTVWNTLSELDLTIRYLQVGPWRTRVLEAGAGPDAVILMHGTGGHLEAYARNVAAFAARYRVIAFDYPGHGYTGHAVRDIEFDTYVGHLRGLLDAEGLDRVHLNGESLGGAVAVKFAAAHPDRVGKLVLNTPGGMPSTPEILARLRTLSQAAADDPTPERIRVRLEWLMADPASVTDELVEIRRAIYARPGFARSMKHILCLQDPDIRARNLITDDEFAAVPGPALVVWTSDNPSGPAAVGRSMAEKIPGGRFELINGAGHWPQWEQPARYNELVLSFLAEPGRRIEVELLPATASIDAAIVARLTELVNQAYATSENGLWLDGATRTIEREMAELTSAGEIAVARLDGRIVGCIRVQRLGDGAGEFGMLAAAAERRGIGIGRELVGFAEQHCVQKGLSIMQLELLVPRQWPHPAKEFLKNWYTRTGYRAVRTGSIEESYPALAQMLATPCDFVIYHKNLTG